MSPAILFRLSNAQISYFEITAHTNQLTDLYSKIPTKWICTKKFEFTWKIRKFQSNFRRKSVTQHSNKSVKCTKNRCLNSKYLKKMENKTSLAVFEFTLISLTTERTDEKFNLLCFQSSVSYSNMFISFASIFN